MNNQEKEEKVYTLRKFELGYHPRRKGAKFSMKDDTGAETNGNVLKFKFKAEPKEETSKITINGDLDKPDRDEVIYTLVSEGIRGDSISEDLIKLCCKSRFALEMMRSWASDEFKKIKSKMPC